jgi:hypothetical protein
VQWDELFSQTLECRPELAGELALPTGGGVYLLTDADDRFIQLASAADLKRTILSRLAPPPAEAGQGVPEAPVAGESIEEAAGPSDSAGRPGTAGAEPPPDPGEAGADTHAAAPVPAAVPSVARKRADLSQIVRFIRWQPAHSAFEITWQYYRIARVVMPATYLKNVAFGPAWFVHVDPAAAIPRLAVTRILPESAGTTLGPFASQQDANRFTAILEDIFDLCRYIHILEQVPHGQPCAYHEMGRCPAPCGGLIPMSEYRESVWRALAFARGQRDGLRERWTAQMRDAAGRLAFEQAAALKQRLDRAAEAEHAAFRHVRDVAEFRWLIVQRGSGRTRVLPFFVDAGRVEAGEMVRLRDLEAAVPAWLARLRAGEDPGASGPASEGRPAEGKQGCPPPDWVRRSEQIWLVSHFLFRKEPGGLFLHAGRLPGAEQLCELIREEFAPAPAHRTEPPDGLGASDQPT